MFLFRKSGEPVDEELPEPKRFSRKELEEQANLLNAQLDGAHEKVRQYDAAQQKTADENAELNGQVSSLKTQCDRLREELRTNQVKLEGCEQINQSLHLANASEAERNGVLEQERNQLKNNCEDARLVASENTELSEKCNALDDKLKKFENLAAEVSEVHKANQRLEKENKCLKAAYERIESEMKALKQTTEKEIVKCKAKAASKVLYLKHLVANPEIMHDTVKDAMVEATKAFVMQKKRKLGNTPKVYETPAGPVLEDENGTLTFPDGTVSEVVSIYSDSTMPGGVIDDDGCIKKDAPNLVTKF